MTVVALPGFTRGPRNLDAFASECAAAGLACVRPSLAPRWIPVLYMVPSRLRRMATSLGGRLTGPVIVAGHSAGAAAGSYLAARVRQADVDLRGLVLIDGVDSPNRLIAKSLPALEGLRVAAVVAPPSPCNRHGALDSSLAQFPWVRRWFVPGAGHGDIEGAGLHIYRRACGDTSDEATANRFRASVMEAVQWVAD
ncbi:MAG: hypothetical protein GC156_06190 [Actinomycetales bacterium]|nr:hypothetical protein [Actinomycetales bacterium]